MIKPMREDIGREVIYTGNKYPGGEFEYGVITSFNENNIFVRYRSNKNSQATSPNDLEWAHKNWTRTVPINI